MNSSSLPNPNQSARTFRAVAGRVELLAINTGDRKAATLATHCRVAARAIRATRNPLPYQAKAISFARGLVFGCRSLGFERAVALLLEEI